MCQQSSDSRRESCCICQHHSQSVLCCMKNRLWAIHSTCLPHTVSAGENQGGGGQRHTDLVLRRPRSSGRALIVVLHFEGSLDLYWFICARTTRSSRTWPVKFSVKKILRSGFKMLRREKKASSTEACVLACHGVHSHTVKSNSLSFSNNMSNWQENATSLRQRKTGHTEYKTRTTASQNSKVLDTSAAHDADSMQFGPAPHKNSITGELSFCKSRNLRFRAVA